MSISIRNLIIMIGLSVLFAGCSTGKYVGTNGESFNNNDNTSMGVRYLLGRGVKQDNEKAFSYFSKAADEEDPFAENELAYLYATGKGTDKDNEKAFLYYQKAANHGLASAQYNLGLLYLEGMGTERNRAEAIHWFQQAANSGFEPAKDALLQYHQ